MDINTQKKLDAEFRRILRVIQPYIPYITDNEHLTSYRLWLEKLNDVGPTEREERNRYVMELCYQIQDGILDYPFTQLPKEGPLEPFTPENKKKVPLANSNFKVDFQLESEPNCAGFSAIYPQQQLEHQRYFNSQLYDVNQPHSTNNNLVNQDGYAKTRCHSPESTTPKQRTPHTLSKTVNPYLPQEFHNLMKSYVTPLPPPSHTANYQNGNASDKYIYAVPPSNIQQLVNTVPIERSFFNDKEDEEDGSWYDITDVSTSTITKLDSVRSNPLPAAISINEDFQEQYENKIMELMKIINDLQQKNLKLNENVVTYENAITMRNGNAETSIHNLVGEVNSLKSRLQELKDIKSALKNSQAAAITQWQNTVSTLTAELDAFQRQNDFLKNEVNVLEKKLSDFDNQQKKDMLEYKQRLNAVQRKQLEAMKQSHFVQLKDMEKSFNDNLNKIKTSYENQFMEHKTNFERVIQEKESEIAKLENIIEVQCKRMHEEVTSIRNEMDATRENHKQSDTEKILFLQKCVTRMDKLFKKSESNHIKKVARLKSEISMRDKIIQIQLSSQRAEIVANSNAEKQIEIDSTITQLEERYRRLLESQQNYFVAEKNQDIATIAELRDVIAQHNIDSNL